MCLWCDKESFLHGVCYIDCFRAQVNMTLKKQKFGSTCELPDNFMKKVMDSGVVEHVSLPRMDEARAYYFQAITCVSCVRC
jgi:hypothetical protein